MHDPQKLTQQLLKNGKRTVSFFSGLDESTWQKQVYADGQAWTVKQLFTHIVETEYEIPLLVKQILNGQQGVPQGFDIDRHNLHQVKKAGDLAVGELLDKFQTRREATIKLVAGMRSGELSQRGRHPFLGETEIFEMLRLMALHIQIHIRDVRKAF